MTPDAGIEPVPAEASHFFGDNLELATRYADFLVDRGRLVGVLGPREGARIWSRHLINSVAISPLVSQGSRVADVGSGAGLPGLPLAIARPDLQIRLVESLSRRVRFLNDAVSELGLADRVDVVHARAEDLEPGSVDVVTARAVADFGTLLQWCLPLVPKKGGVFLAIRGESAASELVADRPALQRAHTRADVVEVPAMQAGPPTRVIRVVRR